MTRSEQVRSLWTKLGAVAARRRLPRVLLVPRLARLVLHHGFAPDEVMRWGLLERPQGDVGRYVSDARLKAMQAKLNPPEHKDELKDKARFAEVCARLGLPHPRVLAAFDLRGGEPAHAAGRAALDAIAPGALFLKPRRGAQGRAARVLDRIAAGFVEQDGSVRSARELVDDLAREQRYTTWLVQERLANSAAVQAISPSRALQTLRIITFLDDEGRPFVLGSQWRLAPPDAIKDNFAKGANGNFLCNIDVEHGRIRNAVRLDATGTLMEVVERHPVSGVALAGLAVPHWDEAVGLALRAAVALAPSRTIGWDIALSATGVMVVEANRNWNAQNADGEMGERVRRMVAHAAVLRGG